MQDAEVPSVACCENPDPQSVKACAVCGKTTCKNCRTYSENKPICHECRATLEASLADEKPDTSRLVTAVVGGVTGAVLGGALWAAVVLITEYEVGYVALAVGALAGFGTLLGAGGKKSQVLQGISVLSAVLGLVLGKYFIVAHTVINHTENFAGRSYLDREIIELFTGNLTEFVSGFDFLWLFLALGIAFKVPAPTKVSMSPKK